MSFHDSVSLHSQQYTDNPDYNDLAASISNSLYSLNNSIATLQNIVNNFNSTNHDHDSEQKISSHLSKITASFKQIHLQSTSLKQFQDSDLSPSQSFTKNKLLLEISKAYNIYVTCQRKFNGVIKEINENQKSLLPSSKYDDEEYTANNNIEGQQQQQQQIQQPKVQIEYTPLNAEELEYQTMEIMQREQEIQSIETGIQELNTIFQDLAHIVNDQGLLIDDIESNMYSVVGDVSGADNELRRALRYQRNNTKRKCMCLSILVVILLVAVLGILIG